jgi:hypothetical protein
MSLVSLERMMDEVIRQLRRGAKLELEGKVKEAEGIYQEWEGYSCLTHSSLSANYFINQ